MYLKKPENTLLEMKAIVCEKHVGANDLLLLPLPFLVCPQQVDHTNLEDKLFSSENNRRVRL